MDLTKAAAGTQINAWRGEVVADKVNPAAALLTPMPVTREVRRSIGVA